jgi:hypothetical protein
MRPGQDDDPCSLTTPKYPEISAQFGDERPLELEHQPQQNLTVAVVSQSENPGSKQSYAGNVGVSSSRDGWVMQPGTSRD